MVMKQFLSSFFIVVLDLDRFSEVPTVTQTAHSHMRRVDACSSFGAPPNGFNILMWFKALLVVFGSA